MLVWQCTPHFLFGLAEKKTGRARSKRKERLAQNLRMRAGLLNTRVFRIYADEDKRVFCRLAPDLGIRSALPPRVPVCRKFRGKCRKVCSSKFACALLGGGWGLKAGGYPRRPASSADNRQGSASGKRMAGYPGPPWRFPPVSYPRAGGLSTAQGSPCAGRRLPGLCQHTFRTAPVLKPTCTHV